MVSAKHFLNWFIRLFSSYFNFLFKDKIFLFILSVSLLIRFYQVSLNYELWWDAYIYIGMGKFMFSFGDLGIWESFRPLVWPFILGLIWKLGLPVIVVAKFLDVIFSIICINLVYVICLRLYNRTVANFAALIFGTSSLFLMYVGLIVTEPLTVMFMLLSVYYFVRYGDGGDMTKFRWFVYDKNLILSSLFAALSFLTKYPSGIMLIVLLSSLIFSSLMTGRSFNKNIFLFKFKQCLTVGVVFILTMLPYLILNFILYKNPLLPFIAGRMVIETDVWLYGGDYLFYITEFFLYNKLFLLVGLSLLFYLVTKDWKNDKKNVVMFSFILFLIYFTFYVPRKEVRYMVLLLPFLIMLVSSVIGRVCDYLKSSNKAIIRFWPFMVITVIVIIMSQMAVYNSIVQEYQGKQIVTNEMIEEIFEFIESGDVLLSSTPLILSEIDNLVIPTSTIWESEAVYGWQAGNFDLILINSCDYRCEDGDIECNDLKDNFLELVNSENKLLKKLNFSLERMDKDEIVSVENCEVLLFEV